MKDITKYAGLDVSKKKLLSLLPTKVAMLPLLGNDSPLAMAFINSCHVLPLFSWYELADY